MAAQTATARTYNFSPGPAVLPLPVLEEIQRDFLALPGAGASILEISHRGPAFTRILRSAKQRLRDLLAIPDHYHLLFLQGGSRLQFSMTAMNLLRGQSQPADYILTGSWGIAAKEQAEKEGSVRIAWDGKSSNYNHVPHRSECQLNPAAAYVHLTSNETIQGVQFADDPLFQAPAICDMSSDFLSRPVDVSRYGLIYACAQKNAGPAGVTVVIIRDDLLARSSDSLPGYLNYREHAEQDSLYNTPCTFGIYTVDLVARWLLDDVGGLAEIHRRNCEKASLLYRVMDESNGFYRGHAASDCRSLMNVTFRLPSEEVEKEFLATAAQNGLTELKGHRSVGGIRASIYNAMPREGVESLAQFMRDFARK